MLRLIAGAFVAASVLLGILVHPYFLWFMPFVGLNLIQSAFTNWWPMMSFLRRLGGRENASLDRMTHKAISLAEQRRCVAVGHCVDAQGQCCDASESARVPPSSRSKPRISPGLTR